MDDDDAGISRPVELEAVVRLQRSALAEARELIRSLSAAAASTAASATAAPLTTESGQQQQQSSNSNPLWLCEECSVSQEELGVLRGELRELRRCAGEQDGAAREQRGQLQDLHTALRQSTAVVDEVLAQRAAAVVEKEGLAGALLSAQRDHRATLEKLESTQRDSALQDRAASELRAELNQANAQCTENAAACETTCELLRERCTTLGQQLDDARATEQEVKALLLRRSQESAAAHEDAAQMLERLRAAEATLAHLSESQAAAAARLATALSAAMRREVEHGALQAEAAELRAASRRGTESIRGAIAGVLATEGEAAARRAAKLEARVAELEAEAAALRSSASSAQNSCNFAVRDAEAALRAVQQERASSTQALGSLKASKQALADRLTEAITQRDAALSKAISTTASLEALHEGGSRELQELRSRAGAQAVTASALTDLVADLEASLRMAREEAGASRERADAAMQKAAVLETDLASSAAHQVAQLGQLRQSHAAEASLHRTALASETRRAGAAETMLRRLSTASEDVRQAADQRRESEEDALQLRLIELSRLADSLSQANLALKQSESAARAGALHSATRSVQLELEVEQRDATILHLRSDLSSSLLREERRIRALASMQASLHLATSGRQRRASMAARVDLDDSLLRQNEAAAPVRPVDGGSRGWADDAPRRDASADAGSSASVATGPTCSQPHTPRTGPVPRYRRSSSSIPAPTGASPSGWRLVVSEGIRALGAKTGRGLSWAGSEAASHAPLLSSRAGSVSVAAVGEGEVASTPACGDDAAARTRSQTAATLPLSGTVGSDDGEYAEFDGGGGTVDVGGGGGDRDGSLSLRSAVL